MAIRHQLVSLSDFKRKGISLLTLLISDEETNVQTNIQFCHNLIYLETRLTRHNPFGRARLDFFCIELVLDLLPPKHNIHKCLDPLTYNMTFSNLWFSIIIFRPISIPHLPRETAFCGNGEKISDIPIFLFFPHISIIPIFL